MTVKMAFTIISTIIQYAPELKDDIQSFVARLNGGEKLEDLIAEFEAKANDLPDLTFGQ